MIRYLLLSVTILAYINSNIYAMQQEQRPATLFDICIKTIMQNPDLYHLEHIPLRIRGEMPVLLRDAILRATLSTYGLESDVSDVEMLLGKELSLFESYTQSQTTLFDLMRKKKPCPIDLIDPGTRMKDPRFMDMVCRKYGSIFEYTAVKRLVAKAALNRNADFIDYALDSGFNIESYNSSFYGTDILLPFVQSNEPTPAYLPLVKRMLASGIKISTTHVQAALPNHYILNELSKKICFKGCQRNCDKLHQNDDIFYQQVANSASPVLCSAFFQAYAGRHLPEQQALLDVMKQAAPETHRLYAAGFTKEGPIGVYMPHTQESGKWIVKMPSDNGRVAVAHHCDIGSERAYTLSWDDHSLSLPNQSSGIAASLTKQKVKIQELCPEEQQRLLQCEPAQYNAVTREDMGLEIFYP